MPSLATTEGNSSRGALCRQPWGLRWRSSVEFVTIVVAFGLFTDQLAYSLIIPVVPYQLKALGYDGIGAKVSWLLVAFSGTLLLATPPIAHFSEVHRNRKVPLLIGLVSLICSQGASAAVTWTVGSALLCDSVPEQSLGRQLGVACAGFTVGSLVGPPAAGALYQHWGFRAPFIPGIIVTGISLLARLLLIERHEAIRWGVDPMEIAVGDKDKDPEAVSEVTASERTEKLPVTEPRSAPEGRSSDFRGGKGDQTGQGSDPCVSLLPHTVLLKLMKSPRAAACIILAIIRGLVSTALETTVILHLSKVWGLDPRKAGLAFVVAIIPTIFSEALFGRLSDKYGSAPIGCAALLLSLPWYGLTTIEGSLAAFLTFFAIEVFFESGVFPILMLEFAAVGRTTENIGYAHVYGAFFLAYSIGTTAGPIIAGQVYDHLDRGWFVIALTAMGCMFAGLILAFFMLGERPLSLRLLQSREQTSEMETSEVQASKEIPREGTDLTPSQKGRCR